MNIHDGANKYCRIPPVSGGALPSPPRIVVKRADIRSIWASISRNGFFTAEGDHIAVLPKDMPSWRMVLRGKRS
jgi:hypothetical protein